ncbi:hypothetical protein [Sedimentitalea todarodis]|uniref:MoeA C-terminal domain-containing protein n=1 Tax=Sedimentitalea todarodis TaxID=1631240 RepID=A0ABU3VDI2_9RHOB|nr:hypothetical protein [Sedimentitalea todarodis]MDU9003794.1 hypothetical protein [Sedimentitalea todarodis]
MTLAKVAVGFARSRRLFHGTDGDGADTDAEHGELVLRELAAPIDVASLAKATRPGQAVQVYPLALVEIRLDSL